MNNRIIDLSEDPASLNVRYDQLIIRRAEHEDILPLEDLAVLIVSHPAVCLTHAVLAGICANSGIFIICNDKRLPTGMMQPLVGNSIQTERFKAQVNTSIPCKKKLWKQVVQAKIRAQAKVLIIKNSNDSGLKYLANRVLSGDSTNIEAQASRRYWPMLFGDIFRRIPGANDGINVHLNYGYAVLRAIVCRSLIGAGLHPSFGIHHHNRYNPYCLADDLMEPFRTLVDLAVLAIVDVFGADHPINKDSKAIMLEKLIKQRYEYEGQSRTLFDITSKMTSSLALLFTGEKQKLLIPEI